MTEEKKLFTVRGYMKSGTNWLCNILNLHPKINCRGEYHWQRLMNGVDEFFKAHPNKHLPNCEQMIGEFYDELDALIKKSILLCDDSDAIWVGDRTPNVIRNDLIRGARHFFIIRDGRDVMVSRAFHLFNHPGMPVFQRDDDMRQKLEKFQNDKDYFKSNPQELLTNEKFIEQTATMWVNVNRQSLDAMSQPECNSMIVRYENLHAETELERKKLYQFLDLDPDEALPLDEKTSPGFKEERPDQFYRKGQTGDWVQYFTPEVKATYNKFAGEMLQELEYVDSLDW